MFMRDVRKVNGFEQSSCAAIILFFGTPVALDKSRGVSCRSFNFP